uniref:HEAT repeat-containing protein n=1 Tax=Candidatus Kentrum sp. MB TaxID=2138164 RepID=A0A450XIX6_9GAMM|nr:MAG: HEAT repeat-containing protein [Candidatus Kentron sp. MB]VFK34229.1 MAG: HEAT repeat-containing protein [Candidatus Kentron sp. MB]VFK76355.1 MAG: HEAT repeat-containing protein [Candidatus Kentron sp. MB]
MRRIDATSVARLGVLGDSSTIPVLSACLRDEDIDVCVDAAEALGHSTEWDQEIAAVLSRTVIDAEQPVRFAALHALMMLAPRTANLSARRNRQKSHSPSHSSSALSGG